MFNPRYWLIVTSFIHSVAIHELTLVMNGNEHSWMHIDLFNNGWLSVDERS